MRILITGATGLVGSNLFERLRDSHEVVGLSRKNGFDLLDREATRLFIETWKPEVVFHLAANASESVGQHSPQDMTDRNLGIFLNVLVPAINVKVKRFIYTSSVAVYGEADVPYTEDDIPKPKDIYGVNKLACEQMMKILSKVHGFDYTIFRPHNIYGPHQDMSNPTRNVIALFMRNIMEEKPVTIFGEGKMRRAFSYVDDVVDVLEAALGHDFKNQTINLGSSIEYGIKDVLERIERIAEKKAIINYQPARPQEIYLFLASHKKLNSFYPYHETPIDEGLRRTWEYINLPCINTVSKEIV